MNTIFNAQELWTADKAAQITDILDTIKYTDIKSVYSGAHGCACGCKGTHTENERSKKIVATKMRRAFNKGEARELMCEHNLIALETATRSYIIYLK